MNELMYLVYGRKIEWWLGGLKELLRQMGVFSSTMNNLGYVVTDAVRDQINTVWEGTDGRGFRTDLLPPALATNTRE